MTEVTINPIALKSVAVATAALTAKLFLTTTIQGGKRFAGGSRPPEDEALGLHKAMSKGAKQTFGMAALTEDDKQAKEAKLLDLRWERIVRNDLENIPIGLIVAWGFLLKNGSPHVHAVSALAFAAARIAHTYVYAKGLQPHRALAWFGGWISIFAMTANGVIGVLSA